LPNYEQHHQVAGLVCPPLDSNRVAALDVEFPRFRQRRADAGKVPAGTRLLHCAGRPAPLRARFSAPCKGARHQQVEVLPEELSMHLGSYLAREAVGDHRREAQRQKSSERRASKRAGSNLSEARAGPESNVADADPAEPRRRPTLLGEGNRRNPAGPPGYWALHVRKAKCATRETLPRSNACETGRGVKRESEGLVVPRKRVTTAEGRGPGMECF